MLSRSVSLSSSNRSTSLLLDASISFFLPFPLNGFGELLWLAGWGEGIRSDVSEDEFLDHAVRYAHISRN